MYQIFFKHGVGSQKMIYQKGYQTEEEAQLEVTALQANCFWFNELGEMKTTLYDIGIEIE